TGRTANLLVPSDGHSLSGSGLRSGDHSPDGGSIGEGSVIEVPTIGETLVPKADSVLGASPCKRRSGGTENLETGVVVDDRLDHSEGGFVAVADPVIERTVRFDVADLGPLGCGHSIERCDLVDGFVA